MRYDLTRTNPFNAVERANRFDRFLERLMGDWDQDWPDLRSKMTWNPSIDLEEKDDEITVQADIPGVQADDLRVSVEDDILTIEGERKEEEKKEE
ncbi:MAG: Hsp20 family protein, partial [Candidatus Sumerlaeota bacterium]